MRQDQLQRLEELAEQLADTFIVEANPSNWSGCGKLPQDMSKDERGNRHWDRKGAMGTGGVLRYTLDLLQSGKKNEINDPDAQADRDSDLDAKIKEAEKRAAKAVSRVLDRAKKDAFGKAPHSAKS